MRVHCCCKPLPLPSSSNRENMLSSGRPLCAVMTACEPGPPTGRLVSCSRPAPRRSVSASELWWMGKSVDMVGISILPMTVPESPEPFCCSASGCPRSYCPESMSLRLYACASSTVIPVSFVMPVSFRGDDCMEDAVLHAVSPTTSNPVTVPPACLTPSYRPMRVTVNA